MGPIRIYCENTESENNDVNIHLSAKKHNQANFDRTANLKPEKPSSLYPEDNEINLFPEAEYGEKEASIRALELQYNADRTVFRSLDYRAPELLPSAEKFQETLENLRKLVKICLEEGGETDSVPAEIYMIVLQQICSDCYEIEEKVSRHAEMMMESYPDDALLCEDMKDIAEGYLDYYLKVYHMMGKHKRKR